MDERSRDRSPACEGVHGIRPQLFPNAQSYLLLSLNMHVDTENICLFRKGNFSNCDILGSDNCHSMRRVL